MAREARGVQSVEVGGRLLAAMVAIGRASMLREIAQEAGLAPAQAHAYLVSYRKFGLVEQDPEGGRYRLGPFALQLGLARLRSFDPLREASRATRELAEELGLMTTVAVWGTHGPTIVQVNEAALPVHVNLRAGAVFTLGGTATGQLFAAFLPAATTRPVLEAEMRAQGKAQRAIGVPRSAEALGRVAAAIRAQGFATTEGVPVPGVNAISVPVFDASGQLQLAVTVIGHADALPEVAAGPTLERAKAVARSLSAALGFMGEFAHCE